MKLVTVTNVTRMQNVPTRSETSLAQEMDFQELYDHYNSLDMEELSSVINNQEYPPETLVSFLSFLEYADKLSLVSTICNLSIKTDSIYKEMLKIISNIFDTSTSFSSFEVFDKELRIRDYIVSFLHISKYSNLFVNTTLSTLGNRENKFFTLNCVKANIEEEELVYDYLYSNSTNFSTYYRTINMHKKLNNFKLRDIDNNNIHTNERVNGTEYIKIRHTPRHDKPWIEHQEIIQYKIDIIENKCITTGRPGIPGSVYTRLSCGTCFIMFPNTCLIVTSKKKSINNDEKSSLLYKFAMTLALYLQLLIRTIEQTLHTCVSLRPSCCDHNIETNFFEYCKACVKFLKINQSSEADVLETRYKEYQSYKATLERLSVDYNFLTQAMNRLIANADANLVLKDMIAHCHKSDFLKCISLGVFGLKYTLNIDALVYINLPREHRKNVCMFTGKKITFRSLRNVHHTLAIYNLFIRISNKLRNFKQEMKRNVFQLTEEDLDDWIEAYENFDLKYEATDME